jgi:hypothetical protein
MASKQAAAKYASDMVPAEYSRLIDEALRLRAGEDGHSLYRNRIERALATRRFILTVVRLCRNRHRELPLVSLLD